MSKTKFQRKSDDLTSSKKSTSGSSFDCTIIFEEERVTVSILGREFSFRELDAWIRSRFAVRLDDQLRYMDKFGAEHIPNKDDVDNNMPIYVKKVKRSSPGVSINNRWFSSFFFVITSTIFILVVLCSNSFIQKIFPVRMWCDQIDLYMMEVGIFPKRGLALEAFSAFACWSSTYLFIRRLLNPETTMTTVEKYAADSFFGGLAAAGSVILKSVFTAAMVGK